MRDLRPVGKAEGQEKVRAEGEDEITGTAVMLICRKFLDESAGFCNCFLHIRFRISG